jgi:uncharacterized protein (DUF58 family)
MNAEPGRRTSEPRGRLNRAARGALQVLWPTQRLLWTREGLGYAAVWGVLLAMGMKQQINLILLVAGLAAGPVVASFLVSASMLRQLRAARRVPPYAFAGEPFPIDYTLENERRFNAALALFLEDEGVPADRAVSGATAIVPRVFFERVPASDRVRVRWTGTAPKRGRYRFRALEIVTRSPFGLFERRVTLPESNEFVIYPAVGRLSRRWNLTQRQATETRRGRRHDRTSQQQEYHGLRDYRPGDSPRWIHWRTSARLGQPMVKEFEQQSEQDLAILLDPWLPRTKVGMEQRETLERAVEFAATLCLETCRRPGRRLLLGWTGATPGIRQGPASVKLLHELLEQLAVLRPATEGSLAALFDTLPPSALRESVLVIVSTRPLNLIEEAERSVRLSGASSRGLLGRILLLDGSRGDLVGLVEQGGVNMSRTVGRREPVADSDDPEPGAAFAGLSRSPSDNGDRNRGEGRL